MNKFLLLLFKDFIINVNIEKYYTHLYHIAVKVYYIFNNNLKVLGQTIGSQCRHMAFMYAVCI